LLLVALPFKQLSVQLDKTPDCSLALVVTSLKPTMELKVGWPMVVVAAIAYYGTLAFYRLFLHPLARFPGPRLAAISRWYEAYYDVVLGGQYTSKIAQLHTIYGPIIRISPYELHVIDPAFFDTLYRTDGRWNKYSWTYDAFGAKGSTIFGSGTASSTNATGMTLSR
jgi:hypothetical protein